MNGVTACPACAAPAGESREIRRTSARYGDSPPLDIRMVECNCGHVFVSPAPTWQELSPFYQSDYHVFADPLPDAASIGRLLAKKRKGDRLNHALIVVGGRYLDIGCGMGEMIAAMAQVGMESEGVEPNQAAVNRTQTIGLKVFCGTLDDAHFPDANFDSISMYHVLEHTHDPVAVLAECRRILKPGGEIVVGVPNFGSLVRSLVGWTWSAHDLPRHLQHFRESSIRRAAARAGLLVSDLETESLPEHVEGELVGWLRRRLMIPARLTQRSHATFPLATYLANRGNASGRGESIVAHLRPDGR
jgi:SAM-dependent methyltransferase